MSKFSEIQKPLIDQCYFLERGCQNLMGYTLTKNSSTMGLYIAVFTPVDGPNLPPRPVFGLHSETAPMHLAGRILFYIART